jgi:DNA-directed RNA polymerase subunit beta'
MSNVEITNPGLSLDARVDAEGELRARKNGLFDPKITGGHGGKGWGHIKLPEPLPNPVFENAIRSLTGLNKKEFDALASGEKAIDKNGTLVELGTSGSQITGVAFKKLLGKIDVKADLEAAKKELSELKVGKSTQKVDALVKKVKYLRALDEMGVKPEDAYIIHHLPVVPPAIRPVSIMNNSVRVTDLNQLYRDFGQVVNQLKNPVLQENLTEDKKKQMRANLYDGLKALMGTDSAQAGEKTARGILHQISGVGSPKRGYFQETLLKRKTDLSMRSTIIPEPSLELDEIGLPKDKALSLYKPFVVRKLVEMGAAKNPLDAHKLIKEKNKYSFDALELVAKERPVLVKRDPALHKHSIQAFRPKIMHGSAIRIHPLTTSGYNADFDGDTMSAYVPISDEAVKEARGMFPSSNLYNEASGKVIYTPTLEMALGLYKTSRIGEQTNKTFKTAADAVKAVQAGKMGLNDVATIAGKKTTTGRVLLASALPESMQSSVLNDDPKNVIDKKGLGELFGKLAKEHKLEFGTTANRLKDIGNGATYGAIGIVHPDHQGPRAISVAEQHGTKRQYVPVPTHSLSLDDFDPDVAIRSKFMKAAEDAVKKLEKSNLKPAEKEQRKIDIYSDASENMMKEHMAKRKAKPTNLSIMVEAGVKPSGGQYQQMVLAPVLMKDASGRTITNPVDRSYSEGLDTAQYWTQMHGARGGTIKKVQEVEDPGVFSKRLMQVSMASAIVADPDCGTTKGISMPVGSKEIYDRVLASDFTAKGLSVPKGTVLTPDVVAKIRAADKNATPLVRSTLKCEHEKGVCQKCAGIAPDGDLYRIGTNLGVISAQSLGERSVQLTLKAFHSGGVSERGGSRAVSSFARVQDLTSLPKRIPNAATVAMRSGTIDKIENDATGQNIWIGGKAHHIGKDTKGNLLSSPLTRDGVPGWVPPKVGMKVDAGATLSDPTRTVINPHDYLKATGSMERVQGLLTDELYKAYRDEGVRRPHVETVVRSMGQLTKILDPGDAHGVLRDEFKNAATVRAINRDLQKQGKKPIMHAPTLKGIETMPLEVQEDWMAKMMHKNLKATVIEAASTGAVSDIHGMHPAAGLAYGAEFGLNKRHALRPGLGHLKDVADYAY